MYSTFFWHHNLKLLTNSTCYKRSCFLDAQKLRYEWKIEEPREGNNSETKSTKFSWLSSVVDWNIVNTSMGTISFGITSASLSNWFKIKRYTSTVRKRKQFLFLWSIRIISPIIHTNWPCRANQKALSRTRTGILAGSRRELGGSLSGIPARVWPPGFLLPAGIPARFSPGSKNSGGQNLAEILPRIWPRSSPGSKFPAAKISARSCRFIDNFSLLEVFFFFLFTSDCRSRLHVDSTCKFILYMWIRLAC